MDEQPQQQQVQLRIDESKMTSTYANTIRTSNTQDELIMDFGMNIPMQVPNQAPMVVFNVGSRVIMNWAGAKRLALSRVCDPPVRRTIRRDRHQPRRRAAPSSGLSFLSPSDNTHARASFGPCVRFGATFIRNK